MTPYERFIVVGWVIAAIGLVVTITMNVVGRRLFPDELGTAIPAPVIEPVAKPGAGQEPADDEGEVDLAKAAHHTLSTLPPEVRAKVDRGWDRAHTTRQWLDEPMEFDDASGVERAHFLLDL